jgi:hypothetical protein
MEPTYNTANDTANPTNAPIAILDIWTLPLFVEFYALTCKQVGD